MPPKKTTAELLDQLTNKKSDKRRSAAKALRKLRDASIGPVLFKAVKQEISDNRTWATQCCMLSALADSGWQDEGAANYIFGHAIERILTCNHTTINFKGTPKHLGEAVHESLAFAAVKVSGTPRPLLEFTDMQQECKSKVVLDTFVDGGLWALAQQNATMSSSDVEKLWNYICGTNLNANAYDNAGGCPDNLYCPFLIFIANSGVDDSLKQPVITRCLSSNHQWLREMAESASTGAKLSNHLGEILSDPS